MAIVFEVIVAAVLVLFVVLGIKRGFVLALCGLLGVVVAFASAGFLAGSLSPLVANALEPHFAAAIEEQLNESIQNSEYISDQGGVATTPEEVPLSGVLDALREMGLYESLIDTIDQAVENGMTEVAANAAAQVAAAMAQSVAYLILFLVGFLVIIILWKAVSHALDLVARLPVLHFLNRTMGGVFGFVQGCLVLFVVAWAIQFMGKTIPADVVEQTVLLKFFMTSSPMALFVGR